MTFRIGAPRDLPRGPVWYIPDYGSNRMDLDTAFRVKIQVLSGKAYTRATARLDQANAQVTDTFALVLRKAIIEVDGLEIEVVSTGEVLRPKDGKELVAALEQAEASAYNDLLMKLAVACMQANVLQAGELGNLQRQRQSRTESGPLPESGLALAAETSPTTTSTNTETPYEGPADATDLLGDP